MENNDSEELLELMESIKSLNKSIDILTKSVKKLEDIMAERHLTRYRTTPLCQSGRATLVSPRYGAKLTPILVRPVTRGNVTWR